MTLNDYANRFLPPYHDTMFLEGFKPWEIWTAAKQAALEDQPAEITIKGEAETK